MIRATKHTISFSNTGKINKKEEFRIACAHAVQSYIDYFWTNGLTHEDKIFNPNTNNWNCPSLSTTKNIELPNECKKLSARALKCCITQALAMIRAVTSKYHKRQKMVKKKIGCKSNKIRKLQSFIDKNIPTKPIINIDKFKIELNSICCSFSESDTSFDAYITLSSLGKSFGKIYIPIKYTERSNYWKSKGKIMKSFLIGKDNIEIRWDVKPETNNSDIIVGADTGQTTCLTLSSGIATTKCKHGHDLKSINKKMSRKRISSRAYKKAAIHQTNYINWSVKQIINQSNIKEIRLESNKNIKKGKKTSKTLMMWSYTQIEKAVNLNCEERNVSVELQNSPYKSQRCSNCGYTHKLNRKSELFLCRKCKFTCNADMNSALNNSQDLAFISRSFMALKKNKLGFYWYKDGLFELNGEALTVPLGKNNDFVCNVSNY